MPKLETTSRNARNTSPRFLHFHWNLANFGHYPPQCCNLLILLILIANVLLQSVFRGNEQGQSEQLVDQISSLQAFSWVMLQRDWFSHCETRRTWLLLRQTLHASGLLGFASSEIAWMKFESQQTKATCLQTTQVSVAVSRGCMYGHRRRKMHKAILHLRLKHVPYSDSLAFPSCTLAKFGAKPSNQPCQLLA